MSDLFIIKDSEDEELAYTIVRLDCVRNKELTWKAKGLHLYLVSHTKDWKLMKEDLIERSKDSSTSLYSGLDELIENKYLYRLQMKDKKGRFTRYIYIVFSSPYSEERLHKNLSKIKEKYPDDSFPSLELPNSGFLNSDMTTHNNNNINNYKENQKEQENKVNLSNDKLMHEVLSTDETHSTNSPDQKDNRPLRTKREKTLNNSNFDREKFKVKSKPKTTLDEQVEPLFNLWLELGFKSKDPKKEKQILNDVLTGEYFADYDRRSLSGLNDDESKFGSAEIEKSFTNYKRWCSAYNKPLTTKLSTFFFNPYNTKIKSLFAVNRKDKIQEEILPEEDDERYWITNTIKSEYCKQILASDLKDVKFSIADEKKFRLATEFMITFHSKHRKKFCFGCNPMKLGKYAIEACVMNLENHGFGIDKFKIGHLSGKRMEDNLLKYLLAKGIINNYDTNQFYQTGRIG